jgi:serine/threonine-protein kinase
VLHPELVAQQGFAEQFQRESVALQKLDHPNIVTVHDVGEADGDLYIAMDLANGPNLAREIFLRGPIPWEETLSTLKPVCEALDYAHRQKVVHRDLKPSNVLLDAERGPLLADFGIAQWAGGNIYGLASRGGVVGTPAYIAPEVWEHDAAEAPADLYALGCIAYEMLTGNVLFGGATPIRSIHAHDRGPQFPTHWPPGVPLEVEPVLVKALARDPNDRYPTAKAFWQALESVDTDETAAKEDRQRAGLAAQWRRETEQEIRAGNWSAAKMAVGRWLAIAPQDAIAPKAQARIERHLRIEQRIRTARAAAQTVVGPGGAPPSASPVPAQAQSAPSSSIDYQKWFFVALWAIVLAGAVLLFWFLLFGINGF